MDFHNLAYWQEKAKNIAIETRLFINGEYSAAADNSVFATIDPAAQQTLAEVARGKKADVDRAVQAARSAFERGDWSQASPAQRKAVLNKFADLMEAHCEELALLETLDTIDPAHIAAHCGEDTRGIYVEASEADLLWDRLDEVRAGGKQAKFMWEIPTSATMDPARAPKVLETIRKVDIYSLNLPEAMSLFQADGEEAAIRAILELGTPCFFRVGKRGSYMIQNGKATFEPSLTVGPIVDATGCGNVSTAAALFGWCEGFPPQVTARLANISAAYNLLQYGPYPAATKQVREEAMGLLNAGITADSAK